MLWHERLGKELAGLLASWTSAGLVGDRPAPNEINFFADLETGQNAFGAK